MKSPRTIFHQQQQQQQQQQQHEAGVGVGVGAGEGRRERTSENDDDGGGGGGGGGGGDEQQQQQQGHLRGGLKDPEGGRKKRYAPGSMNSGSMRDEFPAFRPISPKAPKRSSLDDSETGTGTAETRGDGAGGAGGVGGSGSAGGAGGVEHKRGSGGGGGDSSSNVTLWDNPVWETGPSQVTPEIETPPSGKTAEGLARSSSGGGGGGGGGGSAAAEPFTALVSPLVEAAVARSTQAKERISRAEERYQQAVERLRAASAASAVAKNVQDTSVASSPNKNVNNAGAGAGAGAGTVANQDADNAAADAAEAGNDESSDRKTMREMAAKVEAALARSQLAQERIHMVYRDFHCHTHPPRVFSFFFLFLRAYTQTCLDALFQASHRQLYDCALLHKPRCIPQLSRRNSKQSE